MGWTNGKIKSYLNDYAKTIKGSYANYVAPQGENIPYVHRFEHEGKNYSKLISNAGELQANARSFGDFGSILPKTYRFNSNTGYGLAGQKKTGGLSAVPAIRTADVKKGDKIVLVCDGISDWFPSEGEFINKLKAAIGTQKSFFSAQDILNSIQDDSKVMGMKFSNGVRGDDDKSVIVLDIN